MHKFNFKNSKWLSVVLLVLLIDQATKLLAQKYLQFAIPVKVLPVFNWYLTYNTGAAFSFLNAQGGWQQYIFMGIAIIVSIVLVVWLLRLQEHKLLLPLGLSLILGGAIGNLIDRIHLGFVVDFIQWHVGHYYWPVFNIADAAICVGAFLLIIDSVRASKPL